MDKFDIRYTEIEYKYYASEITLDKFKKFLNSLEEPVDFTKEAASWDIYFSHKKNSKLSEFLPFEFLRFRRADTPELTVKVKHNDNNNNYRTEIDLKLSEELSKYNQEEQQSQVEALVDQFSMEENFRIYKYCYIVFFEKVNIVYYIVYDHNLKEKDRFLEIEARKDKEFESKEEALELVQNMEKKFAFFDISAYNRILRSQWEMWKKST